MQINHNIRAMVTQHALFQNNNAMSKSLEKLSTGLRINRAQDDAAGLAMSEQMRTQIRGLGKAKQNSQDGQAALQIAEGGLAEITNIMQRQRELAIQASNDTLTSTERKYLDDEFQELSKEIGRIALSTDYNGKNLLANGTWTSGGAATPNANHSFGAVDSENNAKSFTLHIGPNYSTGVGGLHANQAPVTYAGINFNGGGDLWDFSIGKYTKNAVNSNGIDFTAGQAVNFSELTIIGDGGTSVNGVTGSQQRIYDTIDSLDAAVKSISGARAKIGTYINRLDYTVNNLASLEFNTQEAESRIRDTNFATETTNFTRNQILVQSATSMLAQANTLPQTVLGLLG
jgi:flagellin